MAAKRLLPKMLVFDLDGCTWFPEMYHLWGGGGSPFEVRPDGDLTDAGGNKVFLMADLREILLEIKTDSKWSDLKVGVASSCDEPEWARECIEKFTIASGIKLKDVFHKDYIEIYKDSKSHHMKNISKKSGIKLADMIFFDNEAGNCRTVANCNVTVVYTPKGVTKDLFDEALNRFPAPGQIIKPAKRS